MKDGNGRPASSMRMDRRDDTEELHLSDSATLEPPVAAIRRLNAHIVPMKTQGTRLEAQIAWLMRTLEG